MRISKTKVLDFLMRCQIERGGYTGNDIAKLAKNIPVSQQALRKRINYWASTDPAFNQLTYIGQRTISITLDDFILIDQRLKEKPLGRMSGILRDIYHNRQKQGKNPIPQSTFYRFINSQKESLTGGTPRELQWLILFGINVVDTYNLANARASLSTVFTYTDLKTFGGIDIDNIASRLLKAQKWFQQTYPGVNPFEWFPRIRSRSKVIRNHLSRIKTDESLSDQALLIFEAQVDSIVRLKDILIDELIHRMGWIQRFKEGNRQKVENRIRTQWIDKYYDVGDKVSTNPNEGNLAKLEELIDRGKPESDEAELELMKQHLVDYEKIFEHLKKLTNNFSEEERKKMTKNRLIQDLGEPKQYLKAVLTKKLISYIRKGKIAFAHSFNFEKMTDGRFEMEYDELTYRTRLYEAIGFLGRKLRFYDSPSFYRLQYFIHRYLSDATIDLEFRHLWKVYKDLTGHKTPLIIIDSMGIDSRRKSLFAKVHGRYHTIGFADVRAVSLYLIPVFSSNCRSSDSEAMNMMEIVNHAKSVLGEEFKFCAGNAHTVSRVAAGLAFAGHKVILLGRYPHPPTKPGKICLSRLHKHLELIT
jgi:hypothetical protein